MNNIDESRYGALENINAVDQRGITPLHNACFSSNVDIARYLVDKGSNIQAKDTKGLTPLEWASWKGATAVVQYLLEKNATATSKALLFSVQAACAPGMLFYQSFK